MNYTSPWQADAEWLPNGLPANMAAVLHRQYLEANRRGRFVKGPRPSFVGEKGVGEP